MTHEGYHRSPSYTIEIEKIADCTWGIYQEGHKKKMDDSLEITA